MRRFDREAILCSPRSESKLRGCLLVLVPVIKFAAARQQLFEPRVCALTVEVGLNGSVLAREVLVRESKGEITTKAQFVLVWY